MVAKKSFKERITILVSSQLELFLRFLSIIKTNMEIYKSKYFLNLFLLCFITNEFLRKLVCSLATACFWLILDMKRENEQTMKKGIVKPISTSISMVKPSPRMSLEKVLIY
jgi:hypothetical protein